MSSSRRRLLIDCDTGVDDALALLYLTAQADVEIVAIGTVHGNIDSRIAAANTQKILELVGANPPVAVGARRPLAQRLAPFESAHGATGFGSAVLPPPTSPLVAVAAAEQLVAAARSNPGELTLLATGPLTNVALALLLEPDLPNLIPELVVMGGAVRVEGNLTPYAEANIAHDPEAADVVLSSGWSTLLVSLDTTMATFLEPSDIERLTVSDSAVAGVCLDLLRDYLDYYEPLLGGRKCPMHDALAAVLLLDPSLGTFEQVAITVDTSDGPRRGVTESGPPDGTGPTVRHAVRVQRDEVVARVLEALTR